MITINEGLIKDHLAERDVRRRSRPALRGEALREFRTAAWTPGPGITNRDCRRKPAQGPLWVLMLRKLPFETASIERYQRREISVEEALVEMYLEDLVAAGTRPSGVRLFVSDKCLGLVESKAERFPHACWPRCVVHVYRNVWPAGVSCTRNFRENGQQGVFGEGGHDARTM